MFFLFVFCILHRTRFWFKRHGFSVINTNIISYFVVKKHDTSFQTLLGVPCRAADLCQWKHVDVSNGHRDAITFGGKYNRKCRNERGGHR